MPLFSGESSSAASRAAGSTARLMLGLRGLVEIEGGIVQALDQIARARWSAIYRPGGRGYEVKATSRPKDASTVESLPQSAVAGLLQDRTSVVRVVTGSEVLGSVPDVAAAVVLRPEIDLEPTLFLIGPPEEGSFTDEDLEVLEAMVEVFAIALQNAGHFERLQSQVFIDFISGCYNRRAFEEHLNVEMVRARRYGRPLCLLLLDLDDFKRINDDLGHPAGDYVLKRVGEILRTIFRTTDRACRFGGDEFAVIFPETPREDALRLAERLARRIAGIFPDEVINTPLTSSIGVAGYPLDGARAEDLIEAADRALYKAKAEGRNRVVAA